MLTHGTCTCQQELRSREIPANLSRSENGKGRKVKGLERVKKGAEKGSGVFINVFCDILNTVQHSGDGI
jgi:hypothetical protein